MKKQTLSISAAARELQISSFKLEKLIGSGRLGPYCEHTLTGRVVILADHLEDIRSRFMSLSRASRLLGISYTKLQKAMKVASNSTVRITGSMWDLNAIREVIQEWPDDAAESMSLPEGLRLFIHRYARSRINMSFKFEGHKYKPFSGPHRADEHKRILTIIMCTLIEGKALRGTLQGALGEQNVEVDACEWVRQFDQTDLVYFQEKYSGTTLFNYGENYLKPFVHYSLREFRDKFDIYDSEQEVNYRRVRDKCVDLLDSLPDQSPRPQKRRTSIFLTRLQVLEIWSVLISMPGRRALQWGLAFMVAIFLGLRKTELTKLRIEYFILTEDGFLSTTPQGYGMMHFPEEPSKGRYGPSHAYGTLVVPRLVLLINQYLRTLYAHSPRGYGYLLRKIASDPESRYRTTTMSWILSMHGNPAFGALPRKIVEHFSEHDTRHTLGNFMQSTPIRKYVIASKHIERAGQLQMRHNIENKNGSVDETHYKDEVPYELYVKTVDAILNFPWDRDELTKWEQDMELQELGVSPTQAKVLSLDHTSVTPRKDLDDTRQKLDMVRERKRKLRTRPKDMSMTDWTAEHQEMKRMIAEYEAALGMG